jgi:hypothetical protein
MSLLGLYRIGSLYFWCMVKRIQREAIGVDVSLRKEMTNIPPFGKGDGK